MIELVKKVNLFSRWRNITLYLIPLLVHNIKNTNNDKTIAKLGSVVYFNIISSQ